jgi:methionine-rich copper-binding protein CopC
MLKLGLFSLFVAAIASPATSVRHLTLVDSSPKSGAVLTASPREVLLTFNERLDTTRRAISMRGPAGAVVMGPVRSVADTLAFAASITGPLTPGEYTVSWLAGAPAHASIRGRYSFRVGAP